MTQLVSVAQAAGELGLDRRTIHRAITSGDLAATKLGPATGAYVIAVDDLERFKAARNHQEPTK